MFTLAGVVGLVVTLFAWSSKSYRRLTRAVDDADESGAPALDLTVRSR
jgi:hypothetical protein